MREINYTVGIDTITPATIQQAGFQCEYNATAVVFTLSEELAAALENEQGDPTWSVEAVNAEGLMSLYPLAFSQNTARLVLPAALTIPGTTVTLQLSLALLDDRHDLLKKQYYPALKVRFGQSVTGALLGGEEYDRYSRNLVGAMKVAVSAAEDASDSATDAVQASLAAVDAAQRAELAAKADRWVALYSTILSVAKGSHSEQVENFGDTTKGVRVRVTLPAGTALPNNRLTAAINLNGNRQMIVRGEGMSQSNTPTVCSVEIMPFAGVWNVNVAPYAKSIGSVTGDLTHGEGDKVRYFNLQANSTNPIPAGTKIEFWGLE